MGLNIASRAFASEGEAILTNTPIYPPFLLGPRFQSRSVAKAPMVLDGDRWVIDWEAMEAAVDDRVKLSSSAIRIIPAWVFDKQELEAVAESCRRHDLILCSDEIHCELLLTNVSTLR